MSRKHFVIWGLGLFLLVILTMASMTYLLISKIISIDFVKSNLITTLFLNLTLPIGFSLILWKRFSTIGRSKLTLIPCFIFIVLATALGSRLASIYLEASDFAGNAMMPIVDAAIDGNVATVWIRVKYMLYLLPGIFLVHWGFLALLALGCMEPKHPNSIWQKTKRVFKKPSENANISIKGSAAHV